MARDGNGVFSKPAGTTAVSGTTIESSKFNTLVDDIVADLNLDRPVAAGGTGASTAAGARTNLSAQEHGDVLDDLNTLGANAADGEFLVGAGAGALAWEKLGVAVASLGLSTASIYATYGGTANAVTLTTGLSLSALTTGQEFRFRATSANTGATTINVDGIGTVTAKTVTGAALPSGYIRTGIDTACRYDGTDIIVSRAIEYGSDSNGEYCRAEDGTLVCWNTQSESVACTSSSVLGDYTGTGGAVTFSITFAATPTIDATPEGASSMSLTSVSASGFTPVYRTAVSSGPSSRSTHWVARGTWY